MACDPSMHPEPFFVKWSPGEIARLNSLAAEETESRGYPRGTITPAILNPVYKRKAFLGETASFLIVRYRGAFGDYIELDQILKPEPQNERAIEMSKLIPLTQQLSI